jgi:hypothetical protein
MLLQRGHLAAIGLCCVLNGVATAGEEFSKLEDSEFYSDLTYNPAKGEFSGNQTMIIPSTEGEKVLWRVADG